MIRRERWHVNKKRYVFICNIPTDTAALPCGTRTRCRAPPQPYQTTFPEAVAPGNPCSCTRPPPARAPVIHNNALLAALDDALPK